MTVKEIKAIVFELARSQGIYGRLAARCTEHKTWALLARAATRARCKTTLDFVLFIES